MPNLTSKVGCRVRVEGYECEGTLRFFGPHKFKPGHRCGVELDEPVGKNNGTVDGFAYFACRPGYGLLVGLEGRGRRWMTLTRWFDADISREDHGAGRSGTRA